LALVFHSPINPAEEWEAELKKHIPDLDFRRLEAPGDPAEIDMALCWKPPPGALARFPNLKVIFSLAAGPDHLLSDPDLPDVPIVRMVEPSLTGGVAEYIVLHVMRHHKDQRRFEEQQRARVWEEYFAPPASTRRIGIMGLGAIGGEAARMLKAGASRSPAGRARPSGSTASNRSTARTGWTAFSSAPTSWSASCRRRRRPRAS
jgi:glyoxylate/hydroxypyruvate reductase A